MEAMRSGPEGIARLLHGARSIAVCSHVNPDGDTLGSAAAMALALKTLGKDVSLFCDGKVPDQMAFLPGIREMRVPGETEGPFDVMLSVDVSDPNRLGCCERLRSVSGHTVQIDHHPTNPLFMEINWVDGNAPAACLMIREQIRALGVELDRDMATCLYTGISTDTGNFSFASTNAACFDVMSELMACGLPLAQLNRALFRERPVPQVRLLGKTLNSLCYYAEGQIAVMILTWQDFRDCNALSEHADTMVNFGLDTVGTRMALLAREGKQEGTVKLSLRAKEPDTVNDIAQAFGGGGHPQAAGITMNGTLEESVGMVLDAMIRKLNG